jgi:hypothetical protein
MVESGRDARKARKAGAAKQASSQRSGAANKMAEP